MTITWTGDQPAVHLPREGKYSLQVETRRALKSHWRQWVERASRVEVSLTLLVVYYYYMRGAVANGDPVAGMPRALAASCRRIRFTPTHLKMLPGGCVCVHRPSEDAAPWEQRIVGGAVANLWAGMRHRGAVKWSVRTGVPQRSRHRVMLSVSCHVCPVHCRSRRVHQSTWFWLM